MSIRVYGKSVATYTAWQGATAYQLNDYCRPTEDNDLCYKCTEAGTSDSTVPTPVEPTWPNVVGQTVQDGTVIWTCEDKAEAANPLSVTISAKSMGGYSLKDIWVKSTGGTGDFVVYGSYDNVNWRQIDEITVPIAGRDNRYKGLTNAYPFIKVSTSAELAAKVNEIEIVAGE